MNIANYVFKLRHGYQHVLLESQRNTVVPASKPQRAKIFRSAPNRQCLTAFSKTSSSLQTTKSLNVPFAQGKVHRIELQQDFL
jgi:hypothetical protein